MGHLSPQRKSSKAKEKKQRRLEERAAMAAVCAKVEAANKVSWANKKLGRKMFLGTFPVSPECSWCLQGRSWYL
uniref:Uncharacterized protein n=1 Tax=Cyanoderma ruficeps TaxID=181631 RepID=A0A8C3QQY6_9PASS